MEKLAFKIGEELKLGGAGSGISSVFPSLSILLSAFLANLYIFAGVAILFLLIAGGVMIIAGAGAEDPERTAKGKKAATAAIIGFLVIFTSYWIIQIIGVITSLDILGGGGL